MDAVHQYLRVSVQPLIKAASVVRHRGNLVDDGYELWGSAAEDWMDTGISMGIEQVVDGGGQA
jgi:hypothetical protein